jgi:hypothetical protein
MGWELEEKTLSLVTLIEVAVSVYPKKPGLYLHIGLSGVSLSLSLSHTHTHTYTFLFYW